MFSKFYPSMYVDSAYKIDYEYMYKKGLRGIIFDVDNTLVPHGAPATSLFVALVNSPGVVVMSVSGFSPVVLA